MKAQKNRNETGLKSLYRFLLPTLTLCTAASLARDLAGWLVHRIEGISFPVPNAATIGIIGGADGPTAIFVTSSIAPVWQSILKLLLLIMSILGWRYFNRKK